MILWNQCVILKIIWPPEYITKSPLSHENNGTRARYWDYFKIAEKLPFKIVTCSGFQTGSNKNNVGVLCTMIFLR
jgi:hypothetical protein